MWRSDSPVPEVAPAPAPVLSNPDPGPGMSAGPSVVAGPGMVAGPRPAPPRMSATVSLTKLLKHKGKGGRTKTIFAAVFAAGLAAGLLKVFVFSGGDAKVATAATSTPAPAAATQPVLTAPKPVPPGTASLKPTGTKPAGGSPAAATGAKPRVATGDPKVNRKPAPASTRPTAPRGVAAGSKPAPTGAKSTATAAKAPTKPAAKSDTMPKAAAPAPANGSPLGPDHVDRAAGYAIRFPAGWSKQNPNVKGSWLAEVTDGKLSSISVGLGPDGGHSTADAQRLEALTKSFKARPDTVVEAAGFGTIAGRKCMWHKLSVPAPAGSRLPGSASSAASPVRFSAVHYVAPLGDGRVLKVQVAARQDAFAEMAPRMKQSVDTLKLLDRQPTAGAASAQ